MKIIHTHEDYNNYSGSRSLKLLSEELVRRGHSVTVLTGGDERASEVVSGVWVERFPISGNVVGGIRAKENADEAYRRFLVEADADIMLNYAAQTWASDLAFSVLDDIRAKKIFVPCGYSKLYDKKYKRYFKKLPAHVKKYNQLIYLSHEYRDKVFGDKAGLHNSVSYSIIPNCADEKEFKENNIDFRKKYNIKNRRLVISIGNHYKAKNHPLLWRAVQKLNTKDVHVALIGGAPEKKWRGCYWPCRIMEHVVLPLKLYVDLPREEVVAALLGADVMLHTSSVECDPIVMYESFASRTPMVSTPVGSVPEFGQVATAKKSAEGLAQAVDELLVDESLREQRAQEAHKLWRENFTLEKMVNAYEALYETLVSH